MDAHYERFRTKFMNGSTSNFTDKYEGVKIVFKIEDRSRKLITDTMVFNAHVASSLRFDKDSAIPEVDSSIYDFNPSKGTLVITKKHKGSQRNNFQESRN
ncbi:hypothetical protein BCV72DRAFT_310269 [Rhizopus microsporus var. microsporus]|uniref:Uncharacterized protein n=1 Tax=Rhizopus microsporus var. microsporus TaxID=86635 RepID=A0A1X0QN59_RHIZD|nr:hypothetical protein BCV72DRAFT_310269 [Rhizopus microsporus var. microsporus]